MIELNDKEKKYYQAVLKYLDKFGINTTRDVLYETDGGNMVFMRGRFVGCTLNELVTYVAKIQGKKTEWLD